ncbi:serine/threonine protein kinase, partial [Streptomyces sp. NPDC127110]
VPVQPAPVPPAPVQPYEPPPAVPPTRPGTVSTALLAAVAVVVAAAAGGTVYAVMSGDSAPRTPVTAPSGAAGAPSAGSGSGSASGSAPASGSPGSGTRAGRLPQSYAGTWRATSGSADWRLTLTPGAVGDSVMTLRVEHPGYSCSWRAALRSAPDPVELDASAVTSGTPPTCTPGGWSRLRLLPDGSLVRELSGGDSLPLTYYRE